jgi:Family of unknown function (DUF6454)
MRIAFFLLGLAAAALPEVPQALSDLKLVRVVELKGATYHVQGVDFEKDQVWVTSVDTPRRKGFLHNFSLATGQLMRDSEIQAGARFHPGGIALDGDALWVPVAEYRAHSSAVIERRSKRTLALQSQFEVPDHIGCIAATPDFLIGGNWDSKEFYLWNRQGQLIRKVPNTTGNAYQDMKFAAGEIVASGNLPDGEGAIDWLALPSFELRRRILAGKNDRGVLYTREGMAIHANQLLLLPEDGPSRLFIFDLSAAKNARRLNP